MKKGDGFITEGGYHRYQINGKQPLAHRLIIEKVLGKPIPNGAVTHHIDGNKLNNNNDNLVLCESPAYHGLLHQRARALKESGHANWRRCSYCKQYDKPSKLYFHKTRTQTFHMVCQNKYHVEYKKRGLNLKKIIKRSRG